MQFKQQPSGWVAQLPFSKVIFKRILHKFPARFSPKSSRWQLTQKDFHVMKRRHYPRVPLMDAGRLNSRALREF
jgi:hypothetical protein